jgi:hypothetical protein
MRTVEQALVRISFSGGLPSRLKNPPGNAACCVGVLAGSPPVSGMEIDPSRGVAA